MLYIQTARRGSSRSTILLLPSPFLNCFLSTIPIREGSLFMMESTSPLTGLGTSPLTPALPSSPPLVPTRHSRKRRRVPSSHKSSSASPSPSSSSPSSDSSTQSNSTPTWSTRPVPSGKKSRRRHSDKEKVESLLERLVTLRWDVKHFLRALYRYRSDHKLRVAQKHFLDFAYTELPRHQHFERVVKSKRRKPIVECGHKWVMDELHRELRVLGRAEAFGGFHPPSIKDASPTVKELAPQWLHLLQCVCSDDTASLNASAVQPATLILAIMCHLMRPKKCTNFQITLGLYLYQGGARRRVLDTLCRFGMIVSYSTLQRRLTSLRTEAERRVEAVGQAPSIILTYDNFEFTEGRRGERTGDNREFRSITTALMLEGRRFPKEMWKPSSVLLSAEQIALGLRPQRIDINVSFSVNSHD